MNRKANASRGTATVCAQNTNEHEPKAAEVVRLLARLLAPLVREELSGGTGEDWIDQHRSPLGRRHHCELARSRALPARKVGRRWLVRRSALDAFIEAQERGEPLDVRPANDATPDEGDDPAVRAVLAEAGLELVPQASRSRKGRR